MNLPIFFLFYFSLFFNKKAKAQLHTPEPKTKTTMTCTLKVSLLTVVILAATVINSATSHAHHGNDLPIVVEFHLMAESEFLAEKNLMNEMNEKKKNELHLTAKEDMQRCDATMAQRSSCSGGHLLVSSSQATFYDYIQQCFNIIQKNSWTFVEFIIVKIDDFATAVFASVCMLVLLLGTARMAWSKSRRNDDAAVMTATMTNAVVLLENASNQVELNNENCYEEEGEGKIQSDTSISPSTSVVVEEEEQGSSMLVESYSSAEPSFEGFSSSSDDMHTPTAKTTMLSSYLPINDHPSQEHSDNDRAEEEEDDDNKDDENENDGRGTPSLLTQAITKVSQVYHKLSQSQHDNDDDQEIDDNDDDDPDNMSMSLLQGDRSIEEFQQRFQNIGKEELTNNNSAADGMMKRSMTVPLRMPSSMPSSGMSSSSMLAPASRRRRRRREKTPIRSRNTRRPCQTTTGENRSSSTELNFELSRDGSSENPISVDDANDDTSEEEEERETFPLC